MNANIEEICASLAAKLRGAVLPHRIEEFLSIINREDENLRKQYDQTDEDSCVTRAEYREAHYFLAVLRTNIEDGETSIDLSSDWSGYEDVPVSEYADDRSRKESALFRINHVLEKAKAMGFEITHELRAQIALYDFGPRREPEKIRIAFTKSAFALVWLRFALGHQ